MKRFAILALIFTVADWFHVTAQAASPSPNAAANPPSIQREFRGAWVATVKNIDWPSKPGLSTDEQKAELIKILDRAVALNLNALIFQVRPAADALYASQLEPWSEYLSGEMGKAPNPFYDPLQFLIDEGHARALEIHAWFNPFRARREFLSTNSLPAAANHLTKTHPELVRTNGADLWLDPGDPAVQLRAKAVIEDVLMRYDVDGVHIDDYFYPIAAKDSKGKEIDFPDEQTWKQYVASGGKLSRGDWRRQNIDRFVADLYRTIKRDKSWVKFGISPAGIWRPNFPPGTTGQDAYAQIFADARKWMLQGWADYFAPQIYWTNGTPGHSYSDLLAWWEKQNAKDRHVWPGSAAYHTTDATNWQPDEIVDQVGLARRQIGVTGEIQYSFSALRNETNGLAELLRHRVYGEPALVPASPWLDRKTPGKPAITIHRGAEGQIVSVTWESTGPQKAWLWVLQTETGGIWKTEIVSEARRELLSPGWSSAPPPTRFAVTAVDRVGNTSAPSVVRLSMSDPPGPAAK